jgi:hypothetical protein
MAQINKHLELSTDMWKRLEDLENKPPPEPVTIVQERAKTPPPPPPPPPKIEIPYVPSEEERAEEARRAVRAMLDEEVAKLLEKISSNSTRVTSLEDIEAKRKDPWATMQTYMQGIGFLPYGEAEETDPLKLFGQVCVLLRQDINMCPKIKDLEDAEVKLNKRISEVESFAADDREARAQTAAAESKKIREDLARLEDVVEGLVQKNIEDGDVAGSLRDLTVRVDAMEERRFPKLEARVRALEEAEPVAGDGSGPRKKGFLESLAEVDLAEEVRRLRSTVECMESAMPSETRQTLQYMRSGGLKNETANGGEAATQRKADAAATMSPAEAAASNTQTSLNLVNFRAETDQQFEKFKQRCDKQQQDLSKNLRNHEKKVEMLESKVLDMWKRLPKVLAVLEPLQAQLENFLTPPPMDGGYGGIIDSTGGLGKSVAPVFEGGTGGGYGMNASALQYAAPAMIAPQSTAPAMATPPAPMAAAPGLAAAQAAQAAAATTVAPAAAAAPTAAAPTFLTGSSGTGSSEVAEAGSTHVAAAADPATATAAPVPTAAPQTGGAAAPAVTSAAVPATAPAAAPDAAAGAMATPATPAPVGTAGPGVASAQAAVPAIVGMSGQTAPAAAVAATAPAPTATAPVGGPVMDGQRPLVAGAPSAQAKMMMGGFAPLPEGAAGTGEAGAQPAKQQQFEPMAQMGSLTGLIKVALQSTTNEISLNLRQELHQARKELLGGLDGKANKSELLALQNRLDAWTQKSRPRDRHREAPQPKREERSLSPVSDQDTRASPYQQVQQRSLGASGSMRTASRPELQADEVMVRSRDFVDNRDSMKQGTNAFADTRGSAPTGKASSGAASSPTLSDKKKTCHDKCKEPTCPRSLAMSQSLSRLPALKSAQ